ncbi:hypothetical protein CEUSTIGMA_g6569.t1 [Chlamydomonas eustigma]|uniref:DUF3456 domain-containing protein n=1 Tax=Chlamydomonas eustigma TaxID=1157962 RepID=A0A250X877_9CHLO|nr:hypothetical protein CEUSTIGMA_g6569.t1 [Chlamydomonas eustigma]|eukprot:GAX79129.1 hypothetical protein CEUSTIGMA_g6569.t1 [Chlamydomonas eustigma]
MIAYLRNVLLLSILFFLILDLRGVTAGLPKLESPCSACKSISKELRIRIQNEKPRNHLDMRHRLDSSGQRYGKVIDYKSSELRAVELLDGLCGSGGVGQYALVQFNVSESGKTTSQWKKIQGQEMDALVNGTRYNPAEVEKAKQKLLQNYCGAVLEESEESLEQAIMSGKFDDNLDEIEEFLCHVSTKACPDGTVPEIFLDEQTSLSNEVPVSGEPGATSQHEHDEL